MSPAGPGGDRAARTDAPARLLLVRHGESTWNAQHRWQGQSDPPLSTRGRRQAEAAAGALDGEVGTLWSSDLRRATETAAVLAARLGVVAPVRLDARLRERFAGPWEGLTRDEIEAGWPGYLGERRRPAGFEDDAALARRGRAALAAIAEAVDPARGAAAVVTHGGMIRALERSLGGEAPLLPNLGARWVLGSAGDLRLGHRVSLAGGDLVARGEPGEE